MSDSGIGTTSSLGLADGAFMRCPEAAAPTQLVVMFHGHGNDTCSWRTTCATGGKGAIAVGARLRAADAGRELRLEDARTRRPTDRGRQVLPRRVSLDHPRYSPFGHQHGRQRLGFAIASPEAVRGDRHHAALRLLGGRRGVNNLTEEYLVIRRSAPANADAALAQQEIEEENGGAPEDQPSPVQRAHQRVACDGHAYLKAR